MLGKETQKVNAFALLSRKLDFPKQFLYFSSEGSLKFWKQKHGFTVEEQVVVV